MTSIELPSAWPDDLPLPAGAAPSCDESDADAMRFQFVMDLEGVDLAGFFTRELPLRGWRIVDPITEADGELVIEIEGSGFWGEIELVSLDSGGGTRFWVQLVA